MTQDPALLSDRAAAVAARLEWFYDLSLHLAALFEIVYHRVDASDHDVAMLLMEAALHSAEQTEPFVPGLTLGADAITPTLRTLLLTLADYAGAVQDAAAPPEDAV
jgi:hypothetical protein